MIGSAAAIWVASLLGASVLVSDAAQRTTFGHSVEGRELHAKRHGDPREREVLVVGSIHGDETQGERIVKRLRRQGRSGLAGLALWTVETVNPDGVAAGRRGNARGVDLNRNFAEDWKRIPATSGYYSGPKPLSEPETRATRRLIRRIRPELTIWYHQPWGETLIPCGKRGREPALRYARLSGLAARDCFPSPPGSATGWQRAGARQAAFVVELPGRDLRAAEVRRHARAVLSVARKG